MTFEKINELLLSKGYISEKREVIYNYYYPCLDKLMTMCIDSYGKCLSFTIPLMEGTNIYTKFDRYISVSFDELTIEKLETILEKIENQIIFLNEYKKKKLMYKRKQELSKDF